MDVRVLSDSEVDSNILSLSHLLIECVADGASVGFMENLHQSAAEEYWKSVLTRYRGGALLVFGAFIADALVGTVMLLVNTPPNQPHRADVSKLLVNPKYRRRGVAKALLVAVEEKAREMGRYLLLLDTETGSSADTLYRNLGWKEVGKVPRHALSPSGELRATTYFYKELYAND